MLSGKEFFQKTFEEGYVGDLEQVDIDTPETEIISDEVDAPTETLAGAKVDVEVESDIPDEIKVDVPKFNIDGEEFTVDEIKEWKQNGLRQSDYTKKTQELADQRRELENLRGVIPEVDALSESQRLAKIERDIASKELDLEITNYKVKYPDFDEIKILTEADKRGVYDLEFIYKALRDDNSVASVDIEQIKNQAIEDYKTQIATKKKVNKDITSGSIVSSVSGKVAVDYSDELNSTELEYCRRRGFTPEQYFKEKSKTYEL